MASDESRRSRGRQQLQRLILDLHEGAAVVSAAQFRGWALRLVQRQVGFSSALWLMGSATTDRIHVVYALGPVGSACRPRDSFRQWVNAASLTHAGETQLLRAPGTSLQTVELEASLQLQSCLTVARTASEPAFTDAERALMEQLTPHLFAAWRVCQLLALYARAAGNESRASAIIDEHGVVHAADRRFHGLLRTGWPMWGGPYLPAPLRDLVPQRGTIVAGNAQWQVDETDAGLYLTGRPLGQLGRLTPREHLIARGIIGGQSYAASAAHLGISVNTVRNTIVRIYRKLGVSNKLELAKRAEFAFATETTH
jgi:DNA-binding CsgD family transcriptional regulator